jgi:transposase-like protein
MATMQSETAVEVTEREQSRDVIDLRTRDEQGHFLPGHTAPGPGRPRGSGSRYSQEIAEQICDAIANTNDSLRVIAKRIGVCRDTITIWRREHPDFRAALDLARQCRLEDLHDECLEIAYNEKDYLLAKQKLTELHRWMAHEGPWKHGHMVAITPPPPPQVPGDNAKLVGDNKTIEHETPLSAALKSFERMAAGEAA